MDTRDVIVVGGGPAGSSCAWRLAQRGIDCLVLDAQTFPRLKLCAGWITPEAVADLELEPAAYPHGFLTFDHIYFHFPVLGINTRTTQHSIRRIEFDAWLLDRSGAPVVTHNVRDIRRDGDWYVIDEQFRCRYLIGAGGTKCPVYRNLFRAANPRAKTLQAVTLEQEFPYDYRDPLCHLWFFERGLPGYSWYVPKAGGHLNVGIGGMAARLKANGDDIKNHWAYLIDKLGRLGLVRGHEWNPKGYSYFIRGNVRVVRVGNAFITGDAAGLATRDLCEGIGPAVKSGLLAAAAIADGAEYSLEALARYSSPARLVQRAMDYMLHRRGGRLPNERTAARAA
ncbi:MAG TPA: NAD(P)/FAD-dependent oxidoreductase [Acidiferrobacterales bacterium]